MTLSPAVQDEIAVGMLASVSGFWQKDTPEIDGTSVPEAYRAAIQAKLNRDRQSYRQFREIDSDLHLKAHLRITDAAVARAGLQVTEDQAVTDQLAAEAAEALAESRAAEDRAIAATEHARKCRAEADVLMTKGVPEVATEALVRLEKAVQVATGADHAADLARAESDQLHEALAEARDDLAAAKHVLSAAHAAVSIPPGQAPVSDATIRANSSYMQHPEVWDQLTGADRQRVHNLGMPRAVMPLHEWWSLQNTQRP